LPVHLAKSLASNHESFCILGVLFFQTKTKRCITQSPAPGKEFPVLSFGDAVHKTVYHSISLSAGATIPHIAICKPGSKFFLFDELAIGNFYRNISIG
jgi:hypothetical protein